MRSENFVKSPRSLSLKLQTTEDKGTYGWGANEGYLNSSVGRVTGYGTDDPKIVVQFPDRLRSPPIF